MKKYLFTADLHGNLSQYQRVLDYARVEQINTVILGGDLTPKNPEQRHVLGQRAFLNNYFFPMLKAFIDETGSEVLVIMGNDDYKANLSMMHENRQKCGYVMIDENPYCDSAGFVFGGYSYVPYTPFQWKDWEKRDLETETDTSFRPDVRSEGFISCGDNHKIPYSIYENMAVDSIEANLAEKFGAINPDKLVLVCHAPPYDTVCDYTEIKPEGQCRHVGSRGVRNFIEKYQPRLTLHGHIHDAAEVSGAFCEKIGKTTVVTVSNDHLTERVQVILFTSEEQKCHRKLI